MHRLPFNQSTITTVVDPPPSTGNKVAPTTHLYLNRQPLNEGAIRNTKHSLLYPNDSNEAT
jgi:hypothetical protein